jgi:hypothetical protein
VRSAAVRLDGFRGPLPARVEGAATLLLNGRPAPIGAAVRAGDQVALTLAAAPIGEAREAALVVRALRATFRVESLKARPPAALAFAPVTAPAGRTAFSTFVAPEGFPPGTVLASTSPDLRIATRDGKRMLPAPVDPGQIFQLAAAAPDRAGETRTVEVRLGDRTAVWRITAR